MGEENNEEIANAATTAEKKTEEKSKTSKAKEAAKVAKEAIKKGKAFIISSIGTNTYGSFCFYSNINNNYRNSYVFCNLTWYGYGKIKSFI